MRDYQLKRHIEKYFSEHPDEINKMNKESFWLKRKTLDNYDKVPNGNARLAQHNWCCDDGSPCKKYHDKIITRKELDSVSEEDGFVCYESQMLRNWTAFAGFALTKENHQGWHRYITDEQATSILKDIATVKKGKKDEELAQEFFEHFCKINRIDISELPIMEGALQRKYKTR